MIMNLRKWENLGQLLGPVKAKDNYNIDCT